MVDQSDEREQGGFGDAAVVAGDGAAAVRRRGRTTAGRIAWRCCLFASGLLVLGIVCLGLLVGFLAHGPIAVDGLGSRIADALDARFGRGTVFTLGTTSIVQRGFGPTLSIDGLSIAGSDRQKVLFAPRAEVSIDPFALFFGNVVPKRLEVFDVELRLVLLKNGNLAVAAGRGAKPFFELGLAADAEKDAQTATTGSVPAPAAAAPTPTPTTAAVDQPPGTAASATPSNGMFAAPRRAAVMKEAAQGIRMLLDTITNPQSPIAAVDRLGIKRGRLVIEDQMTGEEVVYKDLDLEFDKVRGGSTFGLSAEGPSQRWAITAAASGTPGTDRHFKINVSNLSMDELQLVAGTRALGFDTDMPISLSFRIGLNADNTLGEAVGRFDLGQGFLRLEDPDQEPLLIDELSGGLHWNGDTRQIEIDRTVYREGTSHFVLGGSILPPLNEGEPWTIGIATSEPGELGPDRLGEHAVTIDRGQFSGRLFLDKKVMQIDRFAFGSGTEGGIALAGQIDWEHGPHVRLGASIDPTSVRVAKRVWPAFMASPIRAWMLSHFQDGLLEAGTIRIDYDEDALMRMRSDRAPPDESVVLDFTLAKGRVAYLPGVPPLEDVVGVGHITGRTSRFTLTSGTMDASGRRIVLTDGSFSIANADVHPVSAELVAHVAGSVEAIGDVLSRDALKAYASLPLDPSTLKGQVDGRLEDTLQLGEQVKGDDNVLRVKATVSNFVAERLIGKEKLDNATMTIAVDPSGLKASGQGRIFGGPATFDIVKTGDKAPDAVINVTLDDAARAKMGLAVIPGVSGPLSAHVTASGLGQPQKMKAQVDLDLGKMAITAAFLGLTKPAGKPAKVSLAVAPTDKGMVIDPVVLDVGTLQARGAIELGADNAFQSARFGSVRISPGDDMKIDVAKGDDTFRLIIRGSTIDARPFLKALTQLPGDSTAPLARSAKAERKETETFKGFDVDLKSGILTGFNKEVMSDVELHLSKRGSQIRQFAVQGKFGRSAVMGAMTQNQRMRVTSQDSGSLLSFIDLYKHMEGGQLSASMLVGDETLEGTLDIQNFILRDEPAMKKLVSESVTSSRPGDSASTAARSVDGNAVAFTKLKVNYQRAGSRLELKDATMYGSAIGLSVDGWLDYAHDRVAMTGTFVPAFAVNNLFSQVPVIGFLLGGAQNEGLFAINFKISGATSSPTLSVNPLSAIAPGFVRKLFGVFDPGGAGTTSFHEAPAQ